MVNLKQFNGNENPIDKEFSVRNISVPIKTDSPQFEALLNEIARDAQERRDSKGEVRPFYAIDLIRKVRLGSIQLPSEMGGDEATIQDVLAVVIRLAEADADVAHILRSHFSQVQQLLRKDAGKSTTNPFLKKVAEGAIIGNAFTELSSRNVGNLAFETTLSKQGDDYRLNGAKYFTTGTLYSDLVVVTASTKEGKSIAVIIPTNREGVRIEDDWDGIGQKLTASGTTRFHNVVVKEEEILNTVDKQTPFNSFPQLYLHAVIAGILRSVVKDASYLVKSRKRTFSFAAAELPREDPQLLQVIGEISSIAYAAESIVLTAAKELDAASSSVVNGVIDFELSHRASLAASQTKVVVDALALKAATILFDVGGASATKQSAHLDRHWRNIRTLASHNPTVYKARAIGDYVVNGNQLPLKEVYF